MLRTTITCLTVILLQACVTNPDMAIPAETDGLSPVYAPSENARKITIAPGRPTINGGKIYTTGNLLFQVEQDSGIHIINYSDPQNPVNTGFIRSLLCKELSVKNGYIYTNNLSDLVVIDLNDPGGVREVSRVPDVFPDLALQYPPKTNQNERLFFECPDPSKGVVIGWTSTTIKKPKCWR